MAELAILGYIIGGYPPDGANDLPSPSLTLALETSRPVRQSALKGVWAGSAALLLAGSGLGQTALALASRSDIALAQVPLSLELSPAAANPVAPISTGAIARLAPPEQAAAQPPITPLAVPPQATEPPLGKGRTGAQLKLPPPPPNPPLPAASIAVQPAAPSLGQVPPSGVLLAEAPPARALQADAPPPPSKPAAVVPAVSPSATQDPALSFDLDAVPAAALAPELVPAEPQDVANLPAMLQSAFAGGVDSLVAIAVGSAEGTRTPRGDYTAAYQGHTDPGNGVWNLGTFSYQHGAASPAEADRKQFQRLQRQAQQLQQIAANLGLELSLAEQLNGIDLANQSPRAALSRGGYLDRLLEARQQGLQGEEAILWARTRAFLDPDTQRWNAPGLGNTTEGITRDQARRMVAVQRAISLREASANALNPTNTASASPLTNPSTSTTRATSPLAQSSSSPPEILPTQPVAQHIGNISDAVSRLLSFDQPQP
ncbi:MAG: hypothetical protein OHK0037_36640 [Elainellaceae cyanobacterium]